MLLVFAQFQSVQWVENWLWCFVVVFPLSACIVCAAIINGDLDRLLVPADSKGRKCGVDNNVIDKPYLLFFNLEKCIDPRVPLYGCKTPQVCVEKCPTTSFIYSQFTCNSNTFNQIRSQLICQMDVQMDSIRSCDDIRDRINKQDCASWYLPSNPCMKLNFHSIYSIFLSIIFHFVFIWHLCRSFLFVNFVRIILYFLFYLFCILLFGFIICLLLWTSFTCLCNICWMFN